MSKNIDGGLKLARKLVDLVDRATRKIRVNLLRYNVDQLDSSNAPIFCEEKRGREVSTICTLGLTLVDLDILSICLV